MGGQGGPPEPSLAQPTVDDLCVQAWPWRARLAAGQPPAEPMSRGLLAAQLGPDPSLRAQGGRLACV